jgi:hypothetical protein
MATSLVGAVYFWPLALLFRRLLKIKLKQKQTTQALGAVTAIAIASILVGNEILLMATTSLYVLTILLVSTIASAQTIIAINKKVHTRFVQKIAPSPEL